MLDKDAMQMYTLSMNSNPFAAHNGIVIERIERDEAEVSVKIRPESMNPYGTTHGGIYFSMGDICAGAAARSDGRIHVTQNASVNFLKASNAGTIHAKSKVIKRGKATCVVEVRVRDDEENLLFAGIYTFFCVEKDKR